MPVKSERLVANADVARIVKGEALDVVVELYDEVSGQAFSLTDLDAATATFPGAPDEDGVVVNVTVAATADAENPGRLVVSLAEEETQAMLAGEGLSWQVNVTMTDGTIRIVQLLEQLDVVASLF